MLLSPRQTSAGDDPTVEQRIGDIIALNAGPHAHEPAKLSKSGAIASDSPVLASGK